MSELLFHVSCKTGQLQIDETMVRVVAPFKKVVWEVERSAVTKIIEQSSTLTVDLTIITATGAYSAPYIVKRSVEKFLAFFPGLATTMPQGNLWYLDPTRRTYIATYTDEKTMQSEAEAAAQFGWLPQNTAGTAGHINVGRTAAKVALLGPISLVTGASRSKDKITVTFLRTPEWLAKDQHEQ